MGITKYDEMEMILNSRLWPGDTLCLKKRPKPGETTGFTGYSKFGILTNSQLPLTIYLRPNFLSEERYNSVDELLADGWVVD